MAIGYVVLLLVIIAAVIAVVWYFVWRKKKVDDEAAAAAAAAAGAYYAPSRSMRRNIRQDEEYEQDYIPGYSIPLTSTAYGRENRLMGESVTVPGIYETERHLERIHNQPRPILDMVPESARHQATDFRRNIIVQPRTDNGIMRPINAELDVENRYNGGYLNL